MSVQTPHVPNFKIKLFPSNIADGVEGMSLSCRMGNPVIKELLPQVCAIIVCINIMQYEAILCLTQLWVYDPQVRRHPIYHD